MYMDIIFVSKCKADAAAIFPQTTLEWLLLVADKPILSPQRTLVALFY